MTETARTDAPPDDKSAVPASWPVPVRVLSPGPGVNCVPVVFASPHSGQHYPMELIEKLSAPLIDLRRTEDAHVNEIFAAAPQAGASLVSAVFARCFVDLNRAADEVDIGMFDDAPDRFQGRNSDRVRAGLGCLPRVAANGTEIYARPLQWREGQARLRHVHDGYHGALRRTVAGAQAIGLGRAVLIDCHSMPSESRTGRRLPHIVLGDRFGASCSHRLIAAAERCLREMGYSVARNAPYAGGYTTRTYGRPAMGLHALQIEINRALYLDEHRVERNDGFDRVRRDMARLIEVLCDPNLIERL